MKLFAILIAMTLPLFAQAAPYCDTVCNRCLPEAEVWGAKFAVWYGYKECAGLPMKLIDFRQPTPSSIYYTFEVDCGGGKIAQPSIPMNLSCGYTGE